MSDASLPLRKAILVKLKADAGIIALVADRVFTYPKADAAKPYISIGPIRTIPDKAAEYDGATTNIQVDVWDAGPEMTVAMKVARAILAALDGVDMALGDSQRLVELIHVEPGTQYITEEDGITVHAAVPFAASTEPTD